MLNLELENTLNGERFRVEFETMEDIEQYHRDFEKSEYECFRAYLKYETPATILD